ncbi:hypothetical protein PBY51_018377 [Eleginops maclovinus]|uniref:Active regulator of SIRT1 n=1 Tax=Eleginops maclovinus TaxID=56733 RepID=A0AAN8AUV4_ELEMC|nr:hypothetical protein PBY51_018377 [Eleginops maclovinus]
MSASLVRRGLELLSEHTDVSKGKKKKQKTLSAADVMDRVSSKRQGVTRQKRRLQGELGPGRNRATVKDKRIRSAVEEFRKKQKKSQLSANLKYFMEDVDKSRESDTAKILSHHSGRQSRNRPDPPAPKASEKESLFTEKEFQQFQKEYFGRTVEKRK